MFPVVPAAVTIASHTMVVVEGGNVTVNCMSAGFPSPTVVWVINASNDTIAIGKVLHLPNIKRYHGGVYTCFVNNTCGSDSKEVDIDVQCEFMWKEKSSNY